MSHQPAKDSSGAPDPTGDGDQGSEASGGDKCAVLRKEVLSTLRQLELVNGQNAGLIFGICEKLATELAVALEDIDTMEELLARDDIRVGDPLLVMSTRTAIDSFQKASDRYNGAAEMIIKCEGLLLKARCLAQILGGNIDNVEAALLAIQADPEGPVADANGHFPLTRRYRKIFKEVMRRSQEWTDELNRRMDEVRNMP